MNFNKLFLLFLSICVSDCDKSFCSSSAGKNETSVKTEYKVMSVEREYIISFKGWFYEPARLGYIASALQKLDDGSGFSIVKRDNPMADYPSDFDLIQFRNNDIVHQSVEMLLKHPLIKSVTPQKMVTRFLSNFDDESIVDDDTEVAEDAEFIDYVEESLCEDCKSTWINGRRSLSLGSAFWPNGVKGRRLLRTVPRQITSILQADVLWEMGVTGAGVRVAIFDTGLSKEHPSFRLKNVKGFKDLI